jgi:DNA-binding NarL/FixJ family response regulator
MATAGGNGQSGMSVTVVVADDHPLMRADLVRVLGRHAELRVVGTAGDGAEAVALVNRLHPDVVLLDIRMPLMDGLQAARAIRAGGDTAVVLISAYDEALYAAAAADVGAAACLSKLAPEEELVAAVMAAGLHLA